ncbi:hypothetical protein [Nannocystis sp. SCPEA4]|uniref:hypothetical protein n=1 Tax=Nannocystis sp. SCPEA4 TaxID=2996787 RepID=UPI00226DD1E9|nr:hypothetical protein [Nannocystis sp. SCPEA4]MCY1055666.1 hypothetical protein [Nannocystis sp. SCPEA4]
MTTPKSATIPLRVGLVAGALVITGCWSIDGDLGVFTEGDTATGGDGTSTSESAGTSVGSDPGTGTAAPTSTGSGDENGESGEWTCPEGQPKLAPLWTAHLGFDSPDHYLHNSFAVLSDGRIAVAAGSFSTFPQGTGVMWVDGDGSSQDWVFSPEDRPGYGSIGIRRAPDDSLVALGYDFEDEGTLMRLTRVPADGSPVTVVDAELGHMAFLGDFALVGDSAVVIGRGYEEDEPFVMWVAQVDLASGALEWEVSPPSVNPVLGMRVTVGPNGEIVAAHATAGGGGAEFKLWRLGDDGSVLWTADLLDPPAMTYELLDLVVTPGEQVVALVQHYYPAKITAHAVGLVEGEVRWETQIAVEDESGAPGFGGALVDPDALVLPVARGPETFYSGDMADPLTVSLVRLSFAGEILDDTPLSLTDLTAGYHTLMPARGKCGDLLLLHAGLAGPEKYRLWSFAP